MSPAETADDRGDTRTRILDAADRLFRHYGYAKTTVADLARELSVSPANVYRFFTSKLEIVEAIAARMLDLRHAHNLAIVASPGTATERMVRFFVDNHRMNVEAFAADPRAYEIVEVAMAEQWPTIADHLVQMTDVLEALIRDGIAAGEFAPQGEVRRAAALIRQAFVSFFHPTLLLQCSDDPERGGPEELAEFLIRALRCP